MLGLIDSFGEDLVVRRMVGNGNYQSGVYTPGAFDDLTIKAVVEVMNADEMMLLPEGSRLKEAIKIYTEESLQLNSSDKLRHADVVVWNDVEFEVQKSERWLQVGLKHWKSVAVLVQAPDAT